MAIDPDLLDDIVRRYVATMSSIRARRVHRLLTREFARYDHVLTAADEDGSPVLLALGADGRAAVCRTDGRGRVADVANVRLDGATVMTSHDLAKDSLPIVAWTLWHPSLERLVGTVTISGKEVPQHDPVADVLRRLGR